MALRLKHWLGIVVISLTAVAAWRLPLDPPPLPDAPVRSAAELRYDSLARELRQTRAALDQLRRGSRLPDEVLSSASDRVSVVVPERAGVDAEDASMLTARIHDLVGALDRRDPRIVVGFAYAADEEGAAGFSVREVDRYELFAGRENGTPYCIYARVARMGLVDQLVHRDANLARAGTLLGPCVQYAQHGLPGTQIRAWLERGGVAMARGERLGARPAPLHAWQRAYLRRLAGARVGSNGSPQGDPMQQERCLAGHSEDCATLFLHPDLVDRVGEPDRRVAARSPALWAGRPRNWPFPADNEYLLSDLQRDFGPEAFRRFWTSDREVRSAFEAAFGVDLGEWLVEWLDDGPGIEPATPTPTLSATFGSLLLVSLMTGLAAFWQKRRGVA